MQFPGSTYLSPVTPTHVLLDHAIDYAGLFPPASLAMGPAVREYGEILAGDDAWALGRFVAPAARLQEFRDAGGGPWRLAAILGNEVARDLEAVARFNALDAGPAVDTVEFRVLTPDALRDSLALVPDTVARFAEWPLGADPEPFVAVVRGTGVGAKFRTGGIVEDAFPDPDMLLRHLGAAIAAGVPFKCTAGLHHPVRGRYRLTYDAGSAQGTMYGFLNVLLATAALQAGLPPDTARAILLEENPAAFELGTSAVRWGDEAFTETELRQVRRLGFQSFGSCSFREPVDELAGLTRLVTRDS